MRGTQGCGRCLPRSLSPADVTQLGRAGVSAFLPRVAGKTSHRPWWRAPLGLPLVRACRGSSRHPHRSMTVIVDGGRGEVILEPDTEIQGRFADRAARDLVQTERLPGRVRRLPSRSMGARAPGRQRGVVGEIPISVELVRTNRACSHEFLYLERSTLPTGGAVQHALSACRAMNGRDVCFRSLDLAGDKLPTSVRIRGNNPAWACARFATPLCGATIQVAAARLLSGVAVGPLRLMFPLISRRGRAAHGARIVLQRLCGAPARRAGTQSEVPLGVHDRDTSAASSPTCWSRSAISSPSAQRPDPVRLGC